MNKFVSVAKVADIPPGTGRTVDVGGIWIALYNAGGTFYAVDNTCPHAGGPLGEGKLSEGIVECPWPGSRFSLRTGERVGNNTITVACCSVRIEGDQIQIALPSSLTSGPMKEAASSAGRSDPMLWE